MSELKEYRKTAAVKAKLFTKGDEDGMTWTKEELEQARENHHHGIKTDPKATIPYIATLENQKHEGCFGKHYLCVGIKGEKWLVDKDIFESTYEPI